MRTKSEESSMTSNTRASNSADISSRTASPPIQRSEFRWYLNTIWSISYTKSLTGHLSLQDLGDLQQLSQLISELLMDGSMHGYKHEYNEQLWEMDEFLDEALSNAVQETMVWARGHEADERYRDAEYLIRRANSSFHGREPLKHMWSHLDKDVLPTMVSMYEKMGDYTAAEICQETLVKFLFFAKSREQVNEEQIQAVVALSTLLSNSHKRFLDLVPNCEESGLFITYRAAVLDVELLNEVLLEQDLIKSETKENYSCTSLHIAVKENATNLARQLIEIGADVNSANAMSRTPLHISATYAGSEMMKLLLDNQANVEAVDEDHRTPLHAAVRGKRPQETIASLVNAGADINAWNSDEESALSLAIIHNLQAVASLLLEQGANVEASDHDKAPLFTAVHHDRTWAVNLLLDNGAKVLTSRSWGHTLLYDAVMKNRESIVQILLDHGEKTRSASYEEDSLWILNCAIDNANVSIVEMLLKARIGNHTRDRNGDTILHRAIRYGEEPHERIVKLLLKHDAFGMKRVNLYGDTVLHLAVKYSRRKMLVMLLQHKPDELPVLCQMDNGIGETPLDIARAKAKGKEDPSVEISVLYLLEKALQLSHDFISATTG